MRPTKLKQTTHRINKQHIYSIFLTGVHSRTALQAHTTVRPGLVASLSANLCSQWVQ
jgi:hypothetical protein